MTPSSNTKPKSPISNDSLLEQLRDMGRGMVKSTTQDLVGGIAQDALSSLFGTPKSGDLKPGQSINLGDKPKAQTASKEDMWPPFMKRREARPAVNPWQNEALQRLRQQESLVAQKIEEIRIELKSLIATMKMVDKEMALAVDEKIVDPGLYHLTFLDRLKTMLKVMRKNMQDSASWLSVMRSRKKERKYWSMYKKKGTEWGLNNERSLATQTG